MRKQAISRRALLKTAAAGTAGLVLARYAPLARAQTGERWATSTDLNIVIHSLTEGPQRLTTSGNDFKPSWSPDGSMLTFFRATQYGADFKDWRSKICVINADGTGLRELTTAEYPNFNPTWTRDGTNRIVFNRYSPTGSARNQVFWTLTTADPGDEELVSDPTFASFEWVCSCLQDGRMLVDRQSARGFQSFLLTPDGDNPTYAEVERPTTLPWHKLSLSPSETKVAYMLDFDGNIPTYNDSVICYAAFDAETLRIYDQVEITPSDLGSIQEYPAWNRDESLLVYDSNESGRYQVYAYRLADGETTKLSPDRKRSDQFADFEGLPK